MKTIKLGGFYSVNASECAYKIANVYECVYYTVEFANIYQCKENGKCLRMRVLCHCVYECF